MSEDWAGTDFLLNTDIHTSNTGDYSLVSGKDNVKQSVKRRLATPLGVLFYDETYGNGVYDRLGEPMDDDWIEDARMDIINCLDAEVRIEVISIDVIIDNENRKALFTVSYYDMENQETDEVQGVISDGGVSV